MPFLIIIFNTMFGQQNCASKCSFVQVHCVDRGNVQLTGTPCLELPLPMLIVQKGFKANPWVEETCATHISWS